MKQIELLIMAILLVISIATSLDFMSYIFRPAPKARYFKNWACKLGFVATALLIYYFINGNKFF